MKTVLFDMDGTLTKPRKRISQQVASDIIELSKVAKVGIVTGSGIDYVIEQCSTLWDDIHCIDIENFTIMPCNGTQVFKLTNEGLQKESEVSMREHLGDPCYQELVRTILKLQSLACDSIKLLGSVCLTGQFISYRGSLLNWCPIGRDSAEVDRKKIY